MADHADDFAAGVERIQRVQRGIERFAVERTEAFIEEQRVDARFMADQVGERQRQREADEEAFATGERAGIAHRVRLPGVNHLQFQRVADFTLQQIATMQATKLFVGEPHQIIQRQPLGEFTEFIPLFGANERI